MQPCWRAQVRCVVWEGVPAGKDVEDLHTRDENCGFIRQIGLQSPAWEGSILVKYCIDRTGAQLKGVMIGLIKNNTIQSAVKRLYAVSHPWTLKYNEK